MIYSFVFLLICISYYQTIFKKLNKLNLFHNRFAEDLKSSYFGQKNKHCVIKQHCLWKRKCFKLLALRQTRTSFKTPSWTQLSSYPALNCVQNHASWRAFSAGFEGLEVLWMFHAAHAAPVRGRAGERREGSVSDRPLTASASAGSAPGPGPRETRQGCSLTLNVWSHQHVQPWPSKFQAGSSFCALASLPKRKEHRFLIVCTSRRSFAAFCPCTRQNLALRLDYLPLLLYSGVL